MNIKKLLLPLISILSMALIVGCKDSKIVNDSISNKDINQQINCSEDVVIATSVAVTEILDALEIKVSGVPTTSYELPESAKDAVEVGNPMSPDLEIIKLLNPTIVINVDTLGKEYENLFTQNNIPSEFVNLSTVKGLKETIIRLGDKFGKSDNATKLIEELESKESELIDKSSQKDKPDVMIVFAAPGSIMIGTDKSYVGNLLEIAGGNNIFAGTNSSFIQVNMEEIVASDPDMILVMMHALPEESRKMVEEEFSKDRWKNINAIKGNNVHYLDTGYFGMSANLKAMEALDKLGVLLYE